jgi:hypothetical protein
LAGFSFFCGKRLTDDNVCFGSSLLDDVDVIKRPVDKLDFGVLGLYRLGSGLVADEERVLIVGVSSVDFVKGRASDVAWISLVFESCRGVTKLYMVQLPVTPVLRIRSRLASLHTRTLRGR